MTGTLYLVATPIGNLEDITLRAIRILNESSIVLAEDTRNSKKLFVAHKIASKLVSYNDFSSQKKIIMIEQIKNSDELSFSGKGTYDAKEIIKTFGFSRFDSNTKNWIVKPDKTLNFIKLDYGFTYVRNF